MQSGTRRVRTIYSVIASSNRLEVLRILNTKSPLSYSELKTLAGFKSKKESGKFAYHLRKLVRQALISLNRAERKYVVTNLGRLVLNLTSQIEEQSVVESGKLYVRTSRMAMEEFNSNKILQSLVREAGMPVEIAQKITSETEARLQKFQTSYLTSPLIREMVNSLLIEHGYDEYRHKLTRLGLPIHDVTELINKIGGGTGGVESVISQTAKAVFSEYLLLRQLPRDVADAHLSGNIHISNTGNWGLIPDTVFLDILCLEELGLQMKNKFISTPRIPKPQNFEDAVSSLIILTSLVTREASKEIVFENFNEYFGRHISSISDEELKKSLTNALLLMPSYTENRSGNPSITIHLNSNVSNSKNAYRITQATLEAYCFYLERTPIPRINLVVDTKSSHDNDVLNAVSKVITLGGRVALSSSNTSRSYSGLRRNLKDGEYEADWTGVLHSLSVNLPRLSYESSRDETYFRAKLALLLQLSVSALSTRREIMLDLVKKGILPTLTLNPDPSSTEVMPLVINLVGLKEAINYLAGEKASQNSGGSLVKKIVETAVKVTQETAQKNGVIAGIAITDDDDIEERFSRLDAEKYGKATAILGGDGSAYTRVPLINPEDLKERTSVEDVKWLFNNLNGGYYSRIDATDLVYDEGLVKNLKDISNKVDFFRLYREINTCMTCGRKYLSPVKRCSTCRSTYTIKYTT